MILDSIKLFTLEKEYKVGHRLEKKMQTAFIKILYFPGRIYEGRWFNFKRTRIYGCICFPMNSHAQQTLKYKYIPSKM